MMDQCKACYENLDDCACRELFGIEDPVVDEDARQRLEDMRSYWDDMHEEDEPETG